MNVRPGTVHAEALSRALALYTRYLETDEAAHSLSAEGVERHRKAVREMQERQNRELTKTAAGTQGWR